MCSGGSGTGTRTFSSCEVQAAPAPLRGMVVRNNLSEEQSKGCSGVPCVGRGEDQKQSWEGAAVNRSCVRPAAGLPAACCRRAPHFGALLTGLHAALLPARCLLLLWLWPYRYTSQELFKCGASFSSHADTGGSSVKSPNRQLLMRKAVGRGFTGIFPGFAQML